MIIKFIKNISVYKKGQTAEIPNDTKTLIWNPSKKNEQFSHGFNVKDLISHGYAIVVKENPLYSLECAVPIGKPIMFVRYKGRVNFIYIKK
ncbi:MAG: hypothetical protein V4509_00540 [Patescibacteria group bacterium]